MVLSKTRIFIGITINPINKRINKTLTHTHIACKKWWGPTGQTNRWIPLSHPKDFSNKNGLKPTRKHMVETRLKCCQQRWKSWWWNLTSKHAILDDMCDISPIRMRNIPNKSQKPCVLVGYICYLSHMTPHFHLGKSPPSQSTKVAATNKRQITMIAWYWLLLISSISYPPLEIYNLD